MTQCEAETCLMHASLRAGTGTGATASANSNGHAEEVGHNVDVPAEVLLDGEHVMSDRYAEVTGTFSTTRYCLPTTIPCARHLASGFYVL